MQQSKQRRKQFRYVLFLLWSPQVSVSIYGLFWDGEQRLLIYRSADLALNCQINQIEAVISVKHPPVASKATQRPQRITLTCSYTNTDSRKVSIISVVSFTAWSRLSVFLLRSQLHNKSGGSRSLIGSMAQVYSFVTLVFWHGSQWSLWLGSADFIERQATLNLLRRATIIGQIPGQQLMI